MSLCPKLFLVTLVPAAVTDRHYLILTPTTFTIFCFASPSLSTSLANKRPWTTVCWINKWMNAGTHSWSNAHPNQIWGDLSQLQWLHKQGQSLGSSLFGRFVCCLLYDKFLYTLEGSALVLWSEEQLRNKYTNGEQWFSNFLISGPNHTCQYLQ